jgi:hypothetical protein
VSTRPRQRTNCQACGVRCYSTPLEVQVHKDAQPIGYWIYSMLRLCPPCRSAQLDFLTKGKTAA